MASIIREATEGDFDALCAIIEEVDQLHRRALPHRFKPPEGPARERAYIADAVRADDVGLFVAEIEGQLVGLVHITVKDVPALPIFVPRRLAVVENLCVLPADRRSGVGSALMGRAEEWARANGATSVELNVYAFNQQAQLFYRDQGYDVLSHHFSKSLDPPDPAGTTGPLDHGDESRATRLARG